MVTNTELLHLIQTIIPKWKNIYVHDGIMFGYTEAAYRTVPKEPCHEVYVVDNSWNGTISVVLNTNRALINDDASCEACESGVIRQDTDACGYCIHAALYNLLENALKDATSYDVSDYCTDFCYMV